MIEYVQGHEVQLRAFHDLSWVDGCGKVFRVFDRLTSGMLCFGVENPQGRFFLKYAGAPCLQYADSPSLALAKLRLASAHYAALRHKALVQYAGSRDYGSGYLCIFRWEDGLPLAPMPDNYKSFRRSPLRSRLEMMDALIDCNVQTEKLGLIIAGLQDKHLLFNEADSSVKLCNMDDYLSLPAVNLRGRLKGSPHYLAPEAYQPGAALDETCSVYALGALAFTFFGNQANQTREGWEASQGLYDVAKKALSADRGERYQTTQSYQEAWRAAVLHSPMSAY